MIAMANMRIQETGKKHVLGVPLPPFLFLPSVVWVLIPNVAQKGAAGPIPTLEVPTGQIHQILSNLFELCNRNVLLSDITHSAIVYPRELNQDIDT